MCVAAEIYKKVEMFKKWAGGGGENEKKERRHNYSP
jgi:hypothetical protein